MSKKNVYDKLVDWFDVHFGFSKTPLKPIPLFTLNPIYWLGALMAVTFAMQITTGLFMLLYYVPNPDPTLPMNAYTSTVYIINSVPLGHLVETLHLYTAYAMILLAFMHLVRNYFGSAHKESRELMWVAGIILGLIVLGFGVTGYLLPWTVISKSATDVAIGFTNFLPGGLGSLARFLISGSGSDAAQLQRFLTLHTVLLPWALALFLGLKVYMYEVHGPAYVPAYGKLRVPGGAFVQWFPKVFLYGVMLVSVFIGTLLAISALFPLVLPPQFSPLSAGQYVVQPDWYLIWVYQILKFQAFEGYGAPFALGVIAVFFVLLILLPFYDRSKRRDLSVRPLFVTIGVIGIAEFVLLTVWGYLTPGEVIPDIQAVLFIGGLALSVAFLMWLVYRMRSKSMSKAEGSGDSNVTSKMTASKLVQFLAAIGHSMHTRFTALFVILLTVSSVALASVVNMLPTVGSNLYLFGSTVFAFAFSMYLMIWMLRRFVIAYERERFNP